MNKKSLFTTILTVSLLFLAGIGGYNIPRLFPSPMPETAYPYSIPSLSRLYLVPQTRNGITASIESYYADVNRLFFTIRIEGEESPYIIDFISIKDSNGADINSASSMDFFQSDPSLHYVDFTPVVTLKDSELKGQLSLTVYSVVVEGASPVEFNFDLTIPVHPAVIYNLKQTAQANRIEILLDRVIITPAYTQAYLCYVKPTNADWGIYEALLEINGKSSSLNEFALLFDSDFGDIGKGSEPDWVPPVDNGRCVKVGFAVGDANPKSITLTIPMLEQSIPEVVPEEELAVARKKLLAEGIDIDWEVNTSPSGGGYSGPVYNKLPDGMSQLEAYQKFLNALGYIYDGPWEFLVKVQP